MLFEPYVLFAYFHLSSGNRVAAYWEIAAQSAYDMISKYKYLIINLVFPLRFLEWEFLSNCTFSWSLPTCTFLNGYL